MHVDRGHSLVCRPRVHSDPGARPCDFTTVPADGDGGPCAPGPRKSTEKDTSPVH